jgi:hypothetical protein
MYGGQQPGSKSGRNAGQPEVSKIPTKKEKITKNTKSQLKSCETSIVSQVLSK